MPTKDFSRRAVERSLELVERTRQLVRERMPYGPDKVVMTPKEARKFLVNLPPAARTSLEQSMGPEQWAQLIQQIYGVSNATSQ